MSDDPLMRQLGKVARAERDADGMADPRLAKALSDDELDAMSARLLGEPVVAPKTKAPARTVVFLKFAGPLALAAAVLLFLMRGSIGPSAVAPGYELIVEGGGREVRSGTTAPDDGPVRVDPDGRLTFILRPRTPGASDVGARVMIEHDDELRAWSVPSRVSAEGVVRIDATAGALAELPKGASRIVLFVGGASHLPTDAESAKRAMQSPSPDVQSLTRDVVVAP